MVIRQKLQFLPRSVLCNKVSNSSLQGRQELTVSKMVPSMRLLYVYDLTVFPEGNVFKQKCIWYSSHNLGVWAWFSLLF